MADWVKTNAMLFCVPRDSAEYSHCRFSLPVISAIPVCTVPPCAEWPVIA